MSNYESHSSYDNSFLSSPGPYDSEPERFACTSQNSTSGYLKKFLRCPKECQRREPCNSLAEIRQYFIAND
ncbi:hypothetical protein KIN20_005703 [Parelaphostrongylus tenuis]|uniref:Uncharacterized protein n=1 Tax=Parelaphostrongylus tenuis TaxID=148309 RepID=A0AAD5QGA4_PARTN|nr:hypothetical protein KIN20_005703 [Parelaphostrongylus tenuis]